MTFDFMNRSAPLPLLQQYLLQNSFKMLFNFICVRQWHYNSTTCKVYAVNKANFCLIFESFEYNFHFNYTRTPFTINWKFVNLQFCSTIVLILRACTWFVAHVRVTAAAVHIKIVYFILFHHRMLDYERKEFHGVQCRQAVMVYLCTNL